MIDIQTEVNKIHHQYGISEMANYKIQQLFEQYSNEVPPNELIDEITLNEAIEKFGIDSQIELIIEECLELATALQKLKRKRGDTGTKLENVIDEIADVKITIKQAENIFGSEPVNERVKFKMNRLKERLLEGVS